MQIQPQSSQEIQQVNVCVVRHCEYLCMIGRGGAISMYIKVKSHSKPFTFPGNLAVCIV